MVTLAKGGAWLVNGQQVVLDGPEAGRELTAMTGQAPAREEAKKIRLHTAFWKTIIRPATWSS